VECSDPLLNDCVAANAGGTCTNSVGSYSCGCAAGYTGDGRTGGTGCTDIDECTAGTDDCGVDTCVNSPGSFVCHALLGTSPFQNLLARFDVTTGEVVATVPFGNDIGTITGANDIDTSPITGEIFGIAKVNGVSNRVLFRMDPATLALTLVGNLGANFSCLTFAPDGTLYGVTGDGATPSETLFLIDSSTAATTLVRALGNGADGEVIAWNPLDGLIYHWSGNGTNVMESIDPLNAFAIANIPFAGPSGEIFGATFDAFTKDFLVTNINSDLLHATTAGVVTLVGGNSIDDMRGPTFTTGALRQTLVPGTGPEAGGNTVTMRSWRIGVGGPATVTFGGNAASNLVAVNNDTITVTPPAGTGTVAVVVNNGTNLRADYTYTYVL
jgi:hypothetical protein